MFNPPATATQTIFMKASSQTTASCFDDRFDAPFVRKNAEIDNSSSSSSSSNNNNNSGDSICNKNSCSEKENHKASNISKDKWGADALSKGNANRVTSKSREGIHGVRMEGQKINNINKYGKERHKARDFTAGAGTIGPQAPSANTTSSTPNWMKDFFDSCQRDSVKLAQDLVENCINDEIRKTWLELTAHRILQELLLVKATETETSNTVAITNNKDTNNTESISEEKEENDTNFTSPYQLKFNGEVDESAFVIFDKLMDAEAMAITKNERDKLFGTKSGDRMVRAIEQIHNSGVMFSPQWKSKYNLPDNLLLLCLDRRKWARAEQESLCRIVQEFDLWKLLPLILDDWGLHTKEWFQELFCRVKEDGWQSQTKTDMHCLIFVCRTYRCMQSLQWTNIRNSLARKVRRCLKILQDHSQKTMGTEATPRGLNPRNTAGNASASSRKFPSHHHFSQISDKDDTISVDATTKSNSLCPSRQEHEFDDSVQSTSHDSDGNSDTKKGRVGNKNLLVATLPSPNDKDWGSKNISVSIRIDNANFISKRDNGDKVETIEQKCASFTLNEVMRLPAEKLCPATGEVLETFETAEKARRSFSNSDTNRYYFKYSILGINIGTPPHMYNGYFWRLKGSHKTPTSLIPQNIKSSRGQKRGSSIENAVTPLSPDTTIEEKSLRYSASTIEEMPVEKLCLRRGLVLETFDTVALARRSVTDTSNLQRLRYILQGRNISGIIPNVFKGYFWRFQGSDRTPCGGYSFSTLSSSSTGADDEVEEMVAGGSGGGENHAQEVPGDIEGPSKKQKLGHDVDFGGESQPQPVDWAII